MVRLAYGVGRYRDGYYRGSTMTGLGKKWWGRLWVEIWRLWREGSYAEGG